MKQLIIPSVLSLCALLLLNGCVAAIGNRDHSATVGQQLVDLKKAKDAGALSDAEYEQQRTRVLK